MKFTDREITSDEYKKICEDFRKIKMDYGITDSNNIRINIKFEEDNNRLSKKIKELERKL